MGSTETFASGPLRLHIVEGDITTSRAEAIVNAANSELWMGAGVAGAIKARGGQEIEREAMALGPITPGQAVITTGGRLPATHVIHAAAMGPDLRTDAGLIQDATKSALRLADDHGLRSIAMPALGTGVGGFPLEQAADVMLRTVKEWQGSRTVREVSFVLFGEPAWLAFVAAARRLFGSSSQTKPHTERDA